MKRIFILLSVLLFAVFAYGQPGQINCHVFREGKFAYRDSSNNLINLKRKGDHQEEEDKKKKIITKFRIRWTGECQYEITQVWSNSKAKRKFNRSVTKISIIKVNGNDSYEYTCACKEREDNKSNGTMVRLGD